MRPSEALEIHRNSIRRIVEFHHARNPRVFGSVLRGEDIEVWRLGLFDDPAGEPLKREPRI